MRSTSGPHGTDSAIISSVTSPAACSKCAGVGRICASSPRQPLVRPEPVDRRDALRLVRAPAHLRPRLADLVAAALGAEAPHVLRVGLHRGEPVADAAAASSIAFGPKPETITRRARRAACRSARSRPCSASPSWLTCAALPERAHDLDRLLEHLEPHVGRRPGVAEDVLVERLAGADAEPEAAVEQDRRRRRGLRDDRRVDAHRRAGHAGGRRACPGACGERADHGPHERALALLVVPRVEVVGDPQPVEPGLPGRAVACSSSSTRGELLAREEVADPHTPRATQALPP